MSERMPKFHTVCKLSDVPEGEARMFVLGDRAIGIFHVDGDFLALANQ